jgi:HTH-type transcriptional regulator / antitoxin HigA
LQFLYQAVLKEIERLFGAKPDIAEANRLDVLTPLVQMYEEQHFAIAPPDPIEAVLYSMESSHTVHDHIEIRS